MTVFASTSERTSVLATTGKPPIPRTMTNVFIYM